MRESFRREGGQARSPVVSIVLPCHDGAAHLEAAVGSVMAQTCKDWELILVDDGSSDGSGALIDVFAECDPRIRAIHLSRNRGLPAALNEGFRHATGAYWTWTSDDNRYEDGAIERMRARLEERPGVDLVYADYVRFDALGGETPVRAAPVASLPRTNGIGACFLYRRELHEELGGFDETLPLAEDYDFWLRASAQFRLEPLHEPLYRYREHASSLTAQRGIEAQAAGWRAVERHLPALEPEARADALLHWARRLFGQGDTARGRENVWRAIAVAPRVALRSEYRGALMRAALGLRPARALERALGIRPPRPVVQFVLPDALGGVTSFVGNLLGARTDDGPEALICWTHHRDSAHAHSTGALPGGAPHSVRIDHDYPHESLFALLRRMRRAAHRGPGVLVANGYFGLAYAAWRDPGKAVVQILHGDTPLHYRLAEEFAPHVDAFVAVSARIRDELVQRLPERADDVHHLPCGVPIPSRRREARDGPLRLVYTGRLDREKGVQSLPEIDRLVRAEGVDACWTIVGSGPEDAALRGAFAGDPRVRFTGALSSEAVAALLPDHDVFVLPSHAEGLPLSLLEAMAAGLVPVASDLPSGMREVIEPGANGFLAPVGESARFAAAIAALDADRDGLERASRAAANGIRARYDVIDRAAAFFALVRDLSAAPRPARARPRLRRGPSRLDRPWIPGAVVRAIRRLSR